MQAPRPKERTVSDLEFEAVFRAASPALQLALLLAREAGLRREAINEFSRSNCDFDHRLISGRTKNGAYYCVPMTARLQERLLWACAGAQEPTEPLLTQYHTGRRRPYHYCALQNMLLAAQRRAAVKGRWTLHDLRRTLARQVYAATHDIRKVQRLLSHSNPMMTLWYLGTSAQELTAADVERGTPNQPERKDQIA